LNQLICMNDQELIDDFLSFNNDSEEFLWKVCRENVKENLMPSTAFDMMKNIMNITENFIMKCQDVYELCRRKSVTK
jgi:hypothetical protein